MAKPRYLRLGEDDIAFPAGVERILRTINHLLDEVEALTKRVEELERELKSKEGE